MRFISGEHPLISCVTSRRCSRPSVFREGVRGDARLHGYIRWRLAFVGLLVPLISKTLFSASLHGITHSIHAVDSALMLRVVPAKSAFSMDRGQPSLPRKLQRSDPPTAR